MKKNFFIISFMPIALIVFNCIKVYFNGYEVVMLLGLDIPLCYGIQAVYNYLWVTCSFTCFGIITLPILLICLIYQIYFIIYFKRKNNSNGNK